MSKVLKKWVCWEVRLGFRVPDLQRVAIKIILKPTTFTTFNVGDSSSHIMNKVRILQSVNHPCIITLF